MPQVGFATTGLGATLEKADLRAAPCATRWVVP